MKADQQPLCLRNPGDGRNPFCADRMNHAFQPATILSIRNLPLSTGQREPSGGGLSKSPLRRFESRRRSSRSAQKRGDITCDLNHGIPASRQSVGIAVRAPDAIEHREIRSSP